jgi:NAD(P)H-dependent FMN reductase
MELSVPVILGTGRDGRATEAVAQFVHTYASQAEEDIAFELVDVRDFPLTKTKPAWEDHEETKDWQKIAESADGFIIVTPEYNHGPPGELKLLLDAAYQEYFDKPVGLVGVSAGGFGGARVIESLKPMLIELGFVVLGSTANISNVQESFPEGGIAEEKSATITDQLDTVLAELQTYMQALQSVRD